MTTIAWDGTYLVADSACVEDTLVVGSVDKIGEYDTSEWGHVLAGGAGQVDEVSAFLDWLADGAHTPIPPAENSERFVILRTGEIIIYEDGCHPICIPRPRDYAWGSGRALALGAIMAGKTALEALQIAAERDCFTRGPFTVLRFPPSD